MNVYGKKSSDSLPLLTSNHKNCETSSHRKLHHAKENFGMLGEHSKSLKITSQIHKLFSNSLNIPCGVLQQ